MDVFGPADYLRMIGHADGTSPAPDQRQQVFIDAMKKQGQQPGAPAAPATGIADGGPVMAAPAGGLPQMPAGAGASPLQAVLAQRQLQGQPGMQPPQMGGVMGMQLVPPR